MHATKKNSYGPQFNAVGGGWYAMERTEQHIKVWYWLRNDPKVPADVRDGKSTINTGAWVSPFPPFFPFHLSLSTLPLRAWWG